MDSLCEYVIMEGGYRTFWGKPKHCDSIKLASYGLTSVYYQIIRTQTLYAAERVCHFLLSASKLCTELTMKRYNTMETFVLPRQLLRTHVGLFDLCCL